MTLLLNGSSRRTRQSAGRSAATRAVRWSVRLVWRWHLEALLVAAIGAVAWRVDQTFPDRHAAVLVGALVLTVVLVVRPVRRAVRWLLHTAHVRAKWTHAAAAAGLMTSEEKIPRIVTIHRTGVGDRLRVQLPRGGTATAIETHAEALAAALEVREVRVEPDPANARYPQVTLVRHDPFEHTDILPWPWTHKGRVSLWDPIPVAVDEHGAPVTIALPERNVLLGGEPGAGKSAALSLLVAAAALDPAVRLWVLDGKLVELAAWRRVAERSVGVEVDDAIDLVEHLRAEMDARYEQLADRDRRKVSPDDGMPLHVVVCDELAHYLTVGDRKQSRAFADGMRDLVSRGRAAGVIVLAATQKPSHDIVPTSLRDLFGFRWALRCSTPQASDTILGAGWATRDYSAAQIDPAQRGVGYLLHEGGTPIRCKAHYLPDDQLHTIADRALDLREAHAAGEGAA